MVKKKHVKNQKDMERKYKYFKHAKRSVQIIRATEGGKNAREKILKTLIQEKKILGKKKI